MQALINEINSLAGKKISQGDAVFLKHIIEDIINKITAFGINVVPSDEEDTDKLDFASLIGCDAQAIPPLVGTELEGQYNDTIFRGENITIVDILEEDNVTIIVVDVGVDRYWVYNFTYSNNVTIGVLRNDSRRITHPINISWVDVLNETYGRKLNLTIVPANNSDSCVPQSSTSIFEFYNRTFPSVMGGKNVSELFENLSRTMGTTKNGTAFKNFTGGLTRHLNETGYAQNFSVTIFRNGTYNITTRVNLSDQAGKNTTRIRIPFRGVNYTMTVNISGLNASALGRYSVTLPTANYTYNKDGVNVTRTAANLTYNLIYTEFVVKEEAVFLDLVLPGGAGHMVALDDLSSIARPNGNYLISMFDSVTQSIFTTEITPDGRIIWINGRYATIISVVSLSPV